MSLHVEQSEEYQRDGRWKWSVWLDGASDELDDVKSVTWHLHPTFENPVQVRTHRKEKFRLDATGWGTFTIDVRIEMRNGTTRETKHELRLTKPDDEAAPQRSGATRKPKVFLSYSIEDAKEVSRLRKKLDEMNIEVMDSNDTAPGSNFGPAVKQMIRSSDAVVGILAGTYPSSWVLAELDEAREHGVKVYTVTDGNADIASDSARDQSVTIDDMSNLDQTAGGIRGFLDAGGSGTGDAELQA